jgi:hypothetical protein
VTFHVSRAGELCQDITVTAAGDARATTRNCITATERPAEPAPPVQPEPPTTPPDSAPPSTSPLRVSMKGPDRRAVGETARFAIEVTNTGTAAVADVEIDNNFETTLQPSGASAGWKWLPGNALGWQVASLAPGAVVRYEVEMRCLRDTPRSCNRVTVSAAGLEPVAAESCLEIAGAGGQPAASEAGRLSLSIADTADPIKVNSQTTYQIVLANKSDASVFEVEIAIKFGEELRLDGIVGPGVRGSITSGGVRFPAIRELRAGENPTIELRFTGVKPGTARVQVEVTSQGQSVPVTGEHTTEVLR